MNLHDNNDNVPAAHLVLDHSNYVVRWNGRRSRFGDTMLFRCLDALVAKPNEPIENAELVGLLILVFLIERTALGRYAHV